MATIVGYTTIKFTDEEMADFVSRIGEAVVTALELPPQMKDVTIINVPEANHTVKPYGHITFFAYTAPGKSVEKKRAMIRGVQDTVDEFFGDRAQVRTVVIIKEHSDENVGVGGVLRADAKKQ